MKLLFKQRFFSWFDSYDIYDENGNTIYVVKGQFAWGHLLRIYDVNGNEVGHVKQKVFSWLPKFEIYEGDQYIGCIKKQFTFLVHKFNVDYNSWSVEGDFLGWDYRIKDKSNNVVATISKKLFNLTDTYVIDVVNEKDGLYALMLTLAIDAEKCSNNNNN